MSVAAIAEQLFAKFQKEFAVEAKLMGIEETYTFANLMAHFANPAFALLEPLLKKHDAESIICLAGSITDKFDVAMARNIYAKMYDTNRNRLWTYVDALLQAKKELTK